MKKIILFLAIAILSSIANAQDGKDEDWRRRPAIIKGMQMHSKEKLEALIEYFGSDDSKVYEFKCYKDKETDELFMKAKYKKDKVYFQGKYYYNVYFKMQLMFKDVNSVYESGDKIYFDIGSVGYIQKAKPPGEGWSDYVENFKDFTMTIYDDDKRKEALRHFKYLVKHPYAGR